MRLVVATDRGVLELAYPWLPVWIAMNSGLLDDLQKELAPKILNRTVDDALLDEAHDLVIEYLCSRYPYVIGLKDYLDSVKKVQVQT